MDHSVSDKLDFEAVGVLQVGGVVAGAAREWVRVGEHQLPAVQLGLTGELIGLLTAAYVERHVVQAWPAAVMAPGRPGWRLFHHDVGVPGPPAPAAGPVLEHPVAKRGEQPAPADHSTIKIWNPQFDVVNRADGGPIRPKRRLALRRLGPDSHRAGRRGAGTPPAATPPAGRTPGWPSP